ncbi:hypothetical protein [Streptomyces sp. NBC_01455]|uniref:LexA family protein n=1 Tax=Streptomyces sp. NBC_01455 TaxID=2903874 RepID=UPI002E32671A|nr:hypothetical protein [Streptomyces sp. NBC_01455]
MAQHRVNHSTRAQEIVLRYIRRHITETCSSPTLQEIGEARGMHSRGSVHYQLVELKTKGAIVRTLDRHRGIQVT